MSFHPSPSIDCHMTPMEIAMPFIAESEQNQGLENKLVTQRSVPRSLANHSRRTSHSSEGKNGCFSYKESTGQYVVRCPPGRSKVPSENSMLCLTQIGTLAFYQALLAEFIGTMLLTLVATCVGIPVASKSIPDLHGALAAGFTLSTLILAFGHISGAHLNPAVTTTFFVARQIDIVRAFCYICIQMLGGVSGSFILMWLAPDLVQGTLGLNTITPGISIPKAITVEAIITFFLCYTVHAICDTQREDIGGSKALAVGLSITVGSLFGGPFTGASMNPARSFGPAVVTSMWKNHWVYWVGPMLGSVIAAILYTIILKKRPPIVVRSSSNIDHEKEPLRSP